MGVVACNGCCELKDDGKINIDISKLLEKPAEKSTRTGKKEYQSPRKAQKGESKLDTLRRWIRSMTDCEYEVFVNTSAIENF